MERSSSSKRSAAGPDSLYIVVRVYEMIPLPPPTANVSGHSSPLMKHVAFGITKVFSKTKIQWPDGQVKALQLYSYPVHPESPGAFVERLWRTVHQKSLAAAVPSHDSSESSRMDDTASISVDDSAPIINNNNINHNKKSFGQRLLRSPPLHHRSQSANSIDMSQWPSHQLPPTTAMCGTAQLFISSLHIDFLQCLLPSTSNTAASIASQRPVQLTDATGDFAVTTDWNPTEAAGNNAVVQVGNVSSKRSNLIRLPQHRDRGGYSGSMGCHEILYLPARPDRQYPVDCHMAISRTILNFLYIYPRLIRSSPSRSPTTRGEPLTIRIQMLHSDGASGTDHLPTPIACVYDHASWNTATLVSSIYTNVVETSESSAVEHDMPIHDEIRIRLPDVLDGNYTVAFTLFSVRTGEAGAPTLTVLSTTSIPLTSVRSTDKTSNIRVATLIPNGKHRVEFGEYRFHFETRILSSIHTSDPHVAASILELSVEKRPGGVAKAESSPSNTALQLGSSTTSMSAVVAFFQVLLYMNLRQLVEACNGTTSNGLESLRSFYNLLATVKSSTLSRPGLANMDSYHLFVKSCVDLFDESCLFESVPSTPPYEEDGDAVDADEPLISETHGVDNDGFEVDYNDIDGSTSNVDKQQRFSWRRWKSQIETNLSLEGVPFSRVPFDASKISPTTPETEFRSWRGHVTTLYDDDETIATAPSFFSSRRSVDTQTIVSTPTAHAGLLAGASMANSTSYDENSIVRHEPLLANRSVGDTEFVKRFRNAAAIIIAPCVAPSLTSVLKSPRDFTGTTSSPFRRESKDIGSNVFNRTVRSFVPNHFLGSLCALTN